MKFKIFAEFLQDIVQTDSRNEMTVKLAEFFKQLSVDEVKPVMYLMQGRLVPKFLPVEFNFSEKLSLRAIEEIFEVKIKEIYSKVGDAGSLVEIVLNENFPVKQNLEAVPFKNKDSAKNIVEVYEDLKILAALSGKGSQEGKLNKYKEIISYLDSLSAKYITRIIVGDLRLGLSEKTVLDSLSWFIAGDKSLRKSIDIAFGARSDLGELAEIILDSKNSGNIEKLLEGIKIKPGIPIASKLVEREKDAESVWKRMPNCFVQPKLDGLRGQLHYSKVEDPDLKIDGENLVDTAQIFSRNMESLTDQFPELTAALKALNIDSIVLDSEIIGFDEKNNKYFTYQETMTRRRKYDIEAFSNTFPVKAMCFDILYLNGEDLTQKPIELRMELLKKILAKQKSSLEILETKQMQNKDELESYFFENVRKGLEGIITKEVGSNYEPGTRNYKWIKLKANTQSDLVDTIDVVVLGYYIGGGDRARFGFGALLAGVYDQDTDKYYSIGKVGSGMKEEDLQIMFKDMQKIRIEEQPENVVVDKTLYPDFWIQPKIIMEIIADEITRSPNHTAARGITTNVPRDDSAKGLSIRFPRMKIWNRTDKDYPNSVKEIIKMYELRKGK